jgi:hypothetical protein
VIARGVLKTVYQRDAHMNQDKEEPNQPNQTLPKINVILGWISAGGDITNNKRKYRKYVFITAR